MSFLERTREVARQIVTPLLVSGSILVVFLFGGEAYHEFGLEAVDSTTATIKYVLGVIGFISFAVLVNRIIRHVIFDGFIASATGTPAPRLLSQISSLVILVIAVSACARFIFNQDLSVLWAASGVAGLVLGMALKELLQDVFAGIALNIDDATRIGDYIQIHRSGDEKIVGQLVEISWRTARVKDMLGDMVSFPNSRFSSFTITNYNLPACDSMRRVFVTLDANVPTDQAIRVLQAGALDALTAEFGHEVDLPWVGVKDLKVDGVKYMIVYSGPVPEVLFVASAVRKAILDHLARAGLHTAVHSIALAERGQDTHPYYPVSRRLGAIIGEMPLCAGLGEAGVKILERDAKILSVPLGDVVTQAGEAGDAFFMLMEGLLEAREAARIAGRKDVPAFMRPGDVFGARTALLGEPHRRTIRARTNVTLLSIGGDALGQLFSEHPQTIELVARNLLATDPGSTSADGDAFAMTVRHMRHMFPSADAWSAARETERDGRLTRQ